MSSSKPSHLNSNTSSALPRQDTRDVKKAIKFYDQVYEQAAVDRQTSMLSEKTQITRAGYKVPENI